jgi:RES domain-containing protein
MSGEFASVEPDGPLYRLARDPDPWLWPDWSYAGPDGTFGNRYDDPEASFRVLYGSSHRSGAFLETLARFRPDLEVLAGLEQIEGEDESPPGVPRARLDTRRIGEATVQGRFADIGDARSLATLRTALAASAIHYGLDEIDAATIRLSAPRAFTQRGVAVRLRATGRPGRVLRHPLSLTARRRARELGGVRAGARCCESLRRNRIRSDRRG